MSPGTIENARIASVSLGYEGHGLLTAMVQLEGPGWAQGFGGRNLGSGDGGSPEQNAALANFVRGMLRVADVDAWDKLRGRYIRVRRRGFDRIEAVGNILKDNWYTGE